MRIFLVMFLAGLSLAAGPITLDSSVDDVLDALDARGKDMKTLSAEMKTSDIDPSVGDVADVRTGRFHYQSLADGESRFHALFDRKITGNRVADVKHEWSYAGGKLIDRDYRTLHQTTRQVLKPGEKMELFKLDGPFPLPLGQDKANVHKHFEVKRLPLEKDDPLATIHLQLTPISGTDLARQFKTIDLWVDPKINMPIRISVLDGNQTSLKQTDLLNPKINEPVEERDFEMEKVDFSKGWNLTDE